MGSARRAERIDGAKMYGVGPVSCEVLDRVMIVAKSGINCSCATQRRPGRGRKTAVIAPTRSASSAQAAISCTFDRMMVNARVNVCDLRQRQPVHHAIKGSGAAMWSLVCAVHHRG
jgi:hypothetical protein